jgi:hypothetical protein
MSMPCFCFLLQVFKSCFSLVPGQVCRIQVFIWFLFLINPRMYVWLFELKSDIKWIGQCRLSYRKFQLAGWEKWSENWGFGAVLTAVADRLHEVHDRVDIFMELLENWNSDYFQVHIKHNASVSVESKLKELSLSNLKTAVPGWVKRTKQYPGVEGGWALCSTMHPASPPP